MRIKQLECFIDLCHTTSLTKTAKNMHMAIPTLSESIERMEAEIGCNLFEKTSKGYFLNEKGESFLNDVQNIVIQYQTALNKLEGFDVVKTVKFGVDPTIYPLYFSRILSEHQATCDEETVVLVHCNFKDFKTALLENRIDICFSYRYTPLPKQLGYIPLLENDICVVMNRDNPLNQKLSIKLDDLVDYKIYYDQSYETNQTKKIINYLASKGAQIKNYSSPENPVSIIEVEVNNGIMIMHKDKRDTYTGNMIMVPISGQSESYGLLYLKDDEYMLKNIIATMKKKF